MNEVIKQDSRNEGIEVSVHFENYTDSKTIVFDLQEVSDEKSMADVFRVFLQYASELEDRDLEQIKLASMGKVKFVLNGSDFKIIGQEYDSQNPIYTMRTFPEKLIKPDGSEAFSKWEGGLLGVATKQTEDFNSFHKQWYIDDMMDK